jgi:hypothetical protein
LDVVLAVAAAAAVQVELEIGVAPGQLGHGIDGRLAERHPSEVGVNDHAGGIDDRLQAGRNGLPGQIGGILGESLNVIPRRSRRCASQDDLALTLQHTPGGAKRDLVPQLGLRAGQRLPLEQLVHARKQAGDVSSRR